MSKREMDQSNFLEREKGVPVEIERNVSKCNFPEREKEKMEERERGEGYLLKIKRYF